MRTFLFAAILMTSSAAYASSPYATRNTPVYHCVAGDNSAAINALLANGGDVEIAAGTCPLAHGLIMPVTGTTLNGAGMGKTILQASKPRHIDIITVGSSRTGSNQNTMTVSNLTADGRLHEYGGSRAKTGRGLAINGTVHADRTHPSGAEITNVELRFGLSGATVAGSNITMTNVNLHGNRKIGLYMAGNSNMPAPYDYADANTIRGSHFDANNLDNRPGEMISDDIDIDRQTSHVTIGGPQPGDGNELSGGDLVLSCDQLSAYPCKGGVGPFLVQGNTISGGDIGGIRVFGKVNGAVISDNILTNTQGTGVTVVGSVTNTIVNSNTIVGAVAYGVHVFPLAGTPMGDGIAVKFNLVTMGNLNKPAFTVAGATNVSLLNNATKSQPHSVAYDIGSAGRGLVMRNNQ